MSATQAKASRRELRKAFGPAAMDAIGARDHQIRVVAGQLNELTETLQNHQAIWQAHRKEFDQVEAAIQRLHRQVTTLEQARAVGLWARVKYLAFGASFA